MRLILTTALLCLTFVQPATAQTYPTLLEAIQSRITSSSTVIPNFDTITIYFQKTGFAQEPIGGVEYVSVAGYCATHSTSSRSIGWAHFNVTFSVTEQGYTRVTSLPFSHPVTGVRTTVTLNFPSLWGGYPDCRYLWVYQDYCNWVNDHNAIAASLPQTMVDFNARYGTNHPTSNYTYNPIPGSSYKNAAPLTADTDNGGVPDWYEILMVHWPGTSISSGADDYVCFCEPCCSCRCKCTHYNARQCDGTTDETTGCVCHGGGTDPEDPDPDDPDDPVLSENAPPLLRALLFVICLFCGAGFFGSFIDSFEKGSF